MKAAKKDSSKPSKKTNKAAKPKKTPKKEALGSGWHSLLLLIISLLAGAWMMFR
jgi:hypothetical protein